MLKLGLTGEMGSGKSFVADIFAQKGIPVYNCDKRSKYLVTTNEDLMEEIKKHFGQNIYEGTFIGDISPVFKNLTNLVFVEGGKANLAILSTLISPFLYADIEEFYETNKEAKFCLVESAILYETGLKDIVDKVIYVSVPEHIRISRAIKRDGITEAQYKIRMESQISYINKITWSAHIIYNVKLEDTLKSVDEIYNRYS